MKQESWPKNHNSSLHMSHSEAKQKLNLIDTHCHIHEADYPLDREAAYQRALSAGVSRLVCVGTDAVSSRAAVQFAAQHEHAWASIGLHPHDAQEGAAALDELRQLAGSPKVVAVGECGLDYFYNNSPKAEQAKMLRAQIELALEHDKPLIFHVREAFDDFWPVFDSYSGIRGVLHSFTDNRKNMERAIASGLYIGVNGISTFTKDEAQIDMYRSIPLQNLLLETDAPFLTPVPLRGNVNEPAYVMCIAKYISDLKSISLEDLARASTSNAHKLLF